MKEERTAERLPLTNKKTRGEMVTDHRRDEVSTA